MTNINACKDTLKTFAQVYGIDLDRESLKTYMRGDVFFIEMNVEKLLLDNSKVRTLFISNRTDTQHIDGSLSIKVGSSAKEIQNILSEWKKLN